ncbi:preprotein translocase subunit SecE [Amorphoplanes nipponensis]|uniref:Protein translocase subunit SecE n=1 Tax=Actinoplanes nipponensis TaxID=135950 RepID=A0A919MTY4_9ACTN|nr:preprotein translocase subunit SecE [Actinoplanes nipponensis]GIE54093.1 protein translocase subunit SecE [Actinoplanes nipponensis]
MAERKRPGDDAAGDRPEDEAYTDSDLQDGAIAAADEPEGRGGDKAESGGVATKREGRRGGNRIGGFFREVVSELRKVIWPTRKELLTYTGVVIAFVTVMTTIVALLDYGFGKAILATFGN